MRNAFSDAIVAAALRDPKVLLLTGDHGYALFDEFRKKCPSQYINCGIAEQNMVGVAAGLAKAGFKPIVYGLAAFIPMRVLEQIKIDVCYEKLPVILIGDGAGIVYSYLGSSHQCTEDIACARSLPELTVLSPADRFEMTATMNLAFEIKAPVYLRMGKSDRGDIHKNALSLVPGQLIRLNGASDNLALIATGSMVATAMQLIDAGLDAEVWSAPSLKPLDSSTLTEIASRVGAIITLEEHSVIGGLGACVAERISAFNPIPVHRIAINDRFSANCGSYEYLLEEHGLDFASVKEKISHLQAL